MSPAQRQGGPAGPAGAIDPALDEPESTEPGFQPLDTLSDDSDDDLTFEEPKPPAVLPDDEEPKSDPTLPSPVGRVTDETARSPHMAGLLAAAGEVPPPRVLTSNPPSAYFPLAAPKPGGAGAKPHAATRPMSPVPGIAPPPGPERPSGPSPAWVEVVPQQPALPPTPYAAVTPPGGAAQQLTPPPAPETPPPAPRAARPQPERRLPVALLATVMFVFGFFGTGALIYWLASQDPGGDPATPDRNASTAAVAPPVEPTPPPVAPTPPPVAPPPPAAQAPPVAPAPVDAAEARRRAEALMALGDAELQRITPHLAVTGRGDLEQAVAVPRSHYDAARDRYEEAGRYDRALLQCVHVRLGAAAERIAVVFDATADAPQVRTIDAVRFPQELRDTAANYRGVARRHYRSAAREAGSFPECARRGAEGYRRTSTALGLPADR